MASSSFVRAAVWAFGQDLYITIPQGLPSSFCNGQSQLYLYVSAVQARLGSGFGGPGSAGFGWMRACGNGAYTRLFEPANGGWSELYYDRDYARRTSVFLWEVPHNIPCLLYSNPAEEVGGPPWGVDTSLISSNYDITLPSEWYPNDWYRLHFRGRFRTPAYHSLFHGFLKSEDGYRSGILPKPLNDPFPWHEGARHQWFWVLDPNRGIIINPDTGTMKRGGDIYEDNIGYCSSPHIRRHIHVLRPLKLHLTGSGSASVTYYTLTETMATEVSQKTTNFFGPGEFAIECLTGFDVSVNTAAPSGSRLAGWVKGWTTSYGGSHSVAGNGSSQPGTFQMGEGAFVDVDFKSDGQAVRVVSRPGGWSAGRSLVFLTTPPPPVPYDPASPWPPEADAWLASPNSEVSLFVTPGTNEIPYWSISGGWLTDPTNSTQTVTLNQDRSLQVDYLRIPEQTFQPRANPWVYDRYGPLAMTEDGTIIAYWLSGGELVAISTSGEENWSFAVPAINEYLLTPVVGPDGSVYFCAGDHSLLALDANGSQQWRLSMPPGARITVEPAVSRSGQVLVGLSIPGINGGSQFGRLQAVSTNGSMLWHLDTPAPVSAAPVLDAEGRVFIGDGSGSIYAVNPDGTLLWQHDAGYGYQIGHLALDTGGRVISVVHPGALVVLDANGTVMGRRELLNPSAGSLLVREDRVLLWEDGKLTSFSIDCLGEKKRLAENSSLGVFLGQNGTVHLDGKCFDSTGTLLWQSDLENWGHAVLGSDGRLYANGYSRGRLPHIPQHSYSVISAFQTAGDRICSNGWPTWRGNQRRSGQLGTMTQPPIVQIIPPEVGSNFIAGSTVEFAATAQDPDGVLTSLRLYLNDALVATNLTHVALAWSNAVPGFHYFRVVALDDAGAATVVSWQFSVGLAANDSFASRWPLTGVPASGTGSNSVATIEVGEPDHYLGAGRSVWWSWTAPTSTNIAILVHSTNTQPILSVYTGTTLAGLTPVIGEPVTGVPQVNGLLFAAQGGTAYHVRVDDVAPNGGTLDISVTYPPQVQILTPTNGATVVGSSSNCLIIAEASDLDGSVERVEFFADYGYLGVATSEPFTLVWTNPPAGEQRLRLRSVDNLGAFSRWQEVSVLVESAPRITRQPSNPGVVRSGNTAYFSGVTAIGSAPLHYQWLLNGQIIPGQSGVLSPGVSNIFLTLDRVRTNQAGNYSVQVSNSWGVATSSNAILTVLPPFPLGDALEAPDLDWTTGGYDLWLGTTETFGSTTIAKSGRSADGASSWIQAVLTGPGELAFRWRISSFQGTGYLEFLLGGNYMAGISGTRSWESRSFSIPSGDHTIKWNYLKYGAESGSSDYAMLDWVSFLPTIQEPGLPIGDSTDLPQLTWTTGGHATWFGQTNTTHDGVDAAQSGPIEYGQQSWMETTVVGPGVLSFWWKVSSDLDYSFLEFYTNGVRQSGRISGEVNWQNRMFEIGTGPHVLRWRYFRNGISENQDCGWVDEVAWYPHSGAPQIIVQPISRVVSPDAEAEFSVIAVGQLPQSYKWYHNGEAADGWPYRPSGSSLRLWPVSDDFAGDYIAVITNALGAATSTVATLTVATTSLGEALDAPQLDWTTAGDIPWVGHYNYMIAHDGKDAARSVLQYEPLEAWMETMVVGAGTLSFWCKVSTHHWNNYVEFLVNGDVVGWGAGEWTQETFNFGGGTNVFRWRHVNEEEFSAGTAWVDEVVWQPYPSPGPTLTDFAYTQGAFEFQVLGEPNFVYRIQASSNLTDWVDILVDASPTGIIRVSDGWASEHPQRYYRAVWP